MSDGEEQAGKKKSAESAQCSDKEGGGGGWGAVSGRVRGHEVTQAYVSTGTVAAHASRWERGGVGTVTSSLSLGPG